MLTFFLNHYLSQNGTKQINQFSDSKLKIYYICQAVQKGLLDSDTIEELAESADLQSKTPAIDVNWDEGTITVKESKEIISIDEAVRRKYIDGQTAQTLSMVVGKIHDVETRKPKVMMQSQPPQSKEHTLIQRSEMTTDEWKSDSLPKQSTPKSKIYLTGLSEPMSLNELVADDKNITLKGKLIGDIFLWVDVLTDHV